MTIPFGPGLAFQRGRLPPCRLFQFCRLGPGFQGLRGLLKILLVTLKSRLQLPFERGEPPSLFLFKLFFKSLFTLAQCVALPFNLFPAFFQLLT